MGGRREWCTYKKGQFMSSRSVRTSRFKPSKTYKKEKVRRFWELIITYGLSNAAACERMQIRPSTMSRWRNEFQELTPEGFRGMRLSRYGS